MNLVKNNQPKANELSHDFLKAPVGSIILRHKGGCVRPQRLKLEPGLYKKCVAWGSGEWGAVPAPKGKAICSFPSWKFTLICSEGEHGAPAVRELNYAGASPQEGVWGDAGGRPVVA